MKHILFIVTSANRIGTSNIKTGYEFSEVADPYLEFMKAGYTVDFASIAGGLTPEDGYDENNAESKLFKASAGFKRLNFSHKLEAVNIDTYDGIFFPGGLGPMVDLAENELVKSIIAKVYESGKVVAAVCHGAVVFLNVKLNNDSLLLKGKNITCFSEQEEAIKGHTIDKVIPFFLEKAIIKEGGIYSNAIPFESHVIIDGNLITGQNPASAKDVAKLIIVKLGNN